MNNGRLYVQMSIREISLMIVVIEDRLNDLGIVDEDNLEVKRLENLKIMLLNTIED